LVVFLLIFLLNPLEVIRRHAEEDPANIVKHGEPRPRVRILHRTLHNVAVLWAWPSLIAGLAEPTIAALNNLLVTFISHARGIKGIFTGDEGNSSLGVKIYRLTVHADILVLELHKILERIL